MPTKTAERVTRVVTPKEYYQLPRQLPESLYKTAGLLKNRRRALYAHLRKIRAEWDRHD